MRNNFIKQYIVYLNFLLFRINFSNKITHSYITPATIPSIITLAITKSSLNTWPPYTIKYPSPAFDTKNSPDITPTNESPIFTFSEFINVDILAGITILVNICHLLALNVFAIFITSLSVFKNPFKFSSIVTTSEIAIAITIIAGVPAPTQIIITGPKRNFGQTI